MRFRQFTRAEADFGADCLAGQGDGGAADLRRGAGWRGDAAGSFGLAQERDRLQREIGKIDGEIAKAEKKLGNDAFLAKAPLEVVDEQKDRLEEGMALRGKLTAALERLAG